ncbi:MAG: PAS domain S-box protein [Zetaproteobacteria bacterium]|nr:PAS domain S-box protein [Zetaproteobacteria bacterium]
MIDFISGLLLIDRCLMDSPPLREYDSMIANRFYTKIIALLLVVFLIVVLPTSLFVSNKIEAFTLATFNKDAKTVSTMVNHQVSAQLEQTRNSRAVLQKMMQSMGNVGDVQWVALLNADGQVIAHSDPSLNQQYMKLEDLYGKPLPVDSGQEIGSLFSKPVIHHDAEQQVTLLTQAVASDQPGEGQQPQSQWLAVIAMKSEVSSVDVPTDGRVLLDIVVTQAEVQQHVLANEEATLVGLLNHVTEHEGILALRLNSADGALMAQSRKEAMSTLTSLERDTYMQHVLRTAELAIDDREHATFYTLFSPVLIENNPHPVGVIEMTLDREGMSAEAMTLRWLMLGSGAVGGVILFSMLLMMFRMVVLNPLVSLETSLRRMVKGEFNPDEDLQARSFGVEEVKRLIEEFNRMIVRVTSTQRELQASERHVRRVVNALSEGVLVVDNNSVIAEVNPAICRILDYLPEELIGQSLHHFFAEKGDVMFSSKVLPMVASAMQRELDKDKGAFLQTLAEAPLSVMIVDGSGKIMTFNHHAERTFGYKASEVIGSPIHILVPDSVRAGHDAVRRDFMSKNSSKLMSSRKVLRGQRKDGTLINVQIGLMFVEMGDEQHVVTVVRDVNVDMDWDLLNQTRFGQMFERNSGDEALSITELRNKAHQIVPAIITGSSVRNDHGEIDGAVLVVKDVRDYLKTVAQKEQVQQQVEHEQSKRVEALSMMAGGVAHDFNNLLLPIIANAEKILARAAMESDDYRGAESILVASSHAARLCRQMMTYAGEGRLHLKVLNLKEVITGMQKLLLDSMPSHLQLHLDLQAHAEPIEADWSEIEQLVLNLVKYATDAYHGEEGEVYIRLMTHDIDQAYLKSSQTYCRSTVVPGRYTMIEIRDNGQIVDEAMIARLFDPFIVDKFTSVGFGLSSVMGIVNSHKGVFHVNSTKIGTQFCVSLPVSYKNMGREAALIEENVQHKLKGHVLIVDDDPLVSAVLEMRLSELGCTSQTVDSGEEAIKVYAELKQDFDLVILDLSMPKMNGDACLQQLKVIDPEIKAVISSGYSKNSLIDVFATIHPVGWLEKPYTAKDLYRVLDSYLDPVDEAV